MKKKFRSICSFQDLNLLQKIIKFYLMIYIFFLCVKYFQNDKCREYYKLFVHVIVVLLRLPFNFFFMNILVHFYCFCIFSFLFPNILQIISKIFQSIRVFIWRLAPHHTSTWNMFQRSRISCKVLLHITRILSLCCTYPSV